MVCVEDPAARNVADFDSEEAVRDYRGRRGLTAAEQEILGPFLVPDRRVLDLGVGAGRTSAALAEGAARYVGLDVAPAMVAAATEAHPDLAFVVGDAADLSAFADGDLDLVVFAYNGIDYLAPDRARLRCLSEVHRVLQPGGTFVFSSHNARALIRRRQPHSGVRGVAVAALQSVSLSWRTLRSLAFWRGSGHLLDPVRSGLHTWTSVPRTVERELSTAGFRHLRTVPGDHPHRPGPFVTPWWYYAFERVDPAPAAHS
jgi:SAM-dependent methyltransferase